MKDFGHKEDLEMLFLNSKRNKQEEGIRSKKVGILWIMKRKLENGAMIIHKKER